MKKMAAREFYNMMVIAIDKATAGRHIYDVPAAAEAAGLTGGEVSQGFTQRWQYYYADGDGGTVSVECYWYDQSRPFQMKPDKHVMKAELKDSAGAMSYVKSYEE